RCPTRWRPGSGPTSCSRPSSGRRTFWSRWPRCFSCATPRTCGPRWKCGLPRRSGPPSIYTTPIRGASGSRRKPTICAARCFRHAWSRPPGAAVRTAAPRAWGRTQAGASQRCACCRRPWRPWGRRRLRTRRRCSMARRAAPVRRKDRASVNLRERLRLMRPAATAASRSEPVWSPEQETPREPPAALARVPALPPQDGAEQRWLATPLGPALCLERAYPLDHRQGRVPLTTCLDVPRRGWQRLLSRALPANFDPARTVFLDLETTGLGRGTGTYAFLVGIGRFLGDHFVVRQYFMRSYPDEPAVLAAVQAELEDAAGLITFNGRSFDWPLLETRATLNRMRLPLLPHLDLLHPARRVWRPITDSCRLGDLEA